MDTRAFGAGGVHLLLESGQDIYQQDRFLGFLDIAPDNRFVVAAAEILDYDPENTTFTTYVWDIKETLSSLDGVESVVPVASYTVTVPHNTFLAPPVIAPNGEQVVIHTDNAIHIARLPSLDVQSTLETIEARLRISAWSPDSALIGTVLTTQSTKHFIVWDIKNNEVYEMTETFRMFDVFATQDGWLLRGNWLGLDDITAFMLCTRLLETCTAYEYSEGSGRGPVLVTPDGTQVFGETRHEDGRYQLVSWTRLPDGVYKQQTNVPDFDIGILATVSPDGRYIQAGGNRMLWRTADWVPIKDVRLDGHFVPDSQILVVFAETLLRPQEGLRLYDAASGELLDSISIQEHFDFELRFMGEDTRLVDISDDGQWVAIILATSAVLIPLEWSEAR